MGCFTCCKNGQSRIFNVLLLGLVNSGKTQLGHILSKQKRDDFSSTNGVHGFKCVIDKDIVNVTEIGGNEEMIKIWHHYYAKTMAVIFVVDCSNFEKLQIDRDLLNSLMSHKYLRGKPFLIVGSKVDLQPELDDVHLSYLLGLEDMANLYQSQTNVSVCGLNYIDDFMLKMRWLKNVMENDYRILKNRTRFDIADSRLKNIPALNPNKPHSANKVTKLFHNRRVHSAPSTGRFISISTSLSRPFTARVHPQPLDSDLNKEKDQPRLSPGILKTQTENNLF